MPQDLRPAMTTIESLVMYTRFSGSSWPRHHETPAPVVLFFRLSRRNTIRLRRNTIRITGESQQMFFVQVQLRQRFGIDEDLPTEAFCVRWPLNAICHHVE